MVPSPCMGSMPGVPPGTPTCSPRAWIPLWHCLFTDMPPAPWCISPGNRSCWEQKPTKKCNFSQSSFLPPCSLSAHLEPTSTHMGAEINGPERCRAFWAPGGTDMFLTHFRQAADCWEPRLHPCKHLGREQCPSVERLGVFSGTAQPSHCGLSRPGAVWLLPRVPPLALAGRPGEPR